MLFYYIESKEEYINILKKGNKKYDIVFFTQVSTFYLNEYVEPYNYQYRFEYIYYLLDYLKDNNKLILISAGIKTKWYIDLLYILKSKSTNIEITNIEYDIVGQPSRNMNFVISDIKSLNKNEKVEWKKIIDEFNNNDSTDGRLFNIYNKKLRKKYNILKKIKNKKIQNKYQYPIQLISNKDREKNKYN
jgi:hypothetical protein